MSILRDDKMRLLFQEAIVTKLAVTQSATRYQMKTTDIFPFFSKSYHSKTDKDFPMKPIPISHKCPKFSVKDSRDNLFQSILKLFKR